MFHVFYVSSLLIEIMGVGGRGRFSKSRSCPWILEIDIYYNFSKKVFFLVSRKKIKFHFFCFHLEISSWLPLAEQSTVGTQEKILPTPMIQILFK